jgi:hypothetical protein
MLPGAMIFRQAVSRYITGLWAVISDLSIEQRSNISFGSVLAKKNTKNSNNNIDSR